MLKFADHEMEKIDRLAQINATAGLDQAKSIIEEFGEFAQAYAKMDRDKATKEDCINEAHDLLLAVLVYLRQNGVSTIKINDTIMCKVYRAIGRYERHGEL